MGRTVQPWTNEEKKQFVEYYKQLLELDVKPTATLFARHFKLKMHHAEKAVKSTKLMIAMKKEHSK